MPPGLSSSLISTAHLEGPKNHLQVCDKDSEPTESYYIYGYGLLHIKTKPWEEAHMVESRSTTYEVSVVLSL